MPFDVERARQAGYSTAEIADFLAQEKRFDTKAARTAGYNDDEILQHLLNVSAPKPATAGQRVRAAGSGVNKAAAGMLGLPVDTIANVIDLVKAPAGFAYSEMTGKPVPDFLAPFDRSKHWGTSAQIANSMNNVGVPTEPERPDDPVSQLLNLGTNIGASMYFGSAIPSPRANAPINSAPKPSASASAQASATPGAALAENAVSVNPQVAVRGGGYNFGHVGDDAATGLSRGQQTALDAGRRIGMRATPGQATGNKLLQRLEAKLESQPMTAGPFDRLKDSNQRTLNRTWARAIGEETDDLSSETLARAHDRISSVFEDVRDDVQRAIDPSDFVTRMREVSDEFEAIAPQVWKNPLVERLVRHAESGGATGRDLGNLTSKLGREANKHMTSPQGDRELGQALYRVKDYVDDLVEQGLEGGRRADYQVARREYRNLALLTERVNTVNPSTGNANGVSLANLLQKKDKAGFLRGGNQSDHYNAVRFAQAHKPLVGDSGTATRMPLTSTLDMLLQAPVNIATRAYTSSPAVDLAVRAQAAGNMAGRAAGGAADVTGVTSPLGLLFGAQSATGLLDDYRGR